MATAPDPLAIAAQKDFLNKIDQQMALVQGMVNRGTGVSPNLINHQYDLAGQILQTKLAGLQQTQPLLGQDYNLARQMQTLQANQQMRDLAQQIRNYSDQSMGNGAMGSAGYHAGVGTMNANLAGQHTLLQDQLARMANQYRQGQITQNTNISDLSNQIQQNEAARQIALAHNAVGLAGDPNFALNKAMSMSSLANNYDQTFFGMLGSGAFGPDPFGFAMGGTNQAANPTSTQQPAIGGNHFIG